MKNIVVKFKAGHVGYAHNLNGAIETHKFEEPTPFGFEKVNNIDPGIDNVFWYLDTVMKQVAEFVKANPHERVQIAVPGTVWALANDIDMLTKTMWTKKRLYNTVQNKDNHRTILLHRKVAEQYALTQPEFTMYQNLFANMKKLMGYVLIMDSQFICSKAENAKTQDAMAWFEVNNACNQLLEIGSKGAVSPYASMGGNGEVFAMPPMGDDSDDLPF